MALDTSEVFGAENMTPEAKETVLDKLAGLASLGSTAVHEAKHVFMSWARQTGTDASYGDLVRLGLKKKRRP